jgi:hypothetical protein
LMASLHTDPTAVHQGNFYHQFDLGGNAFIKTLYWQETGDQGSIRVRYRVAPHDTGEYGPWSTYHTTSPIAVNSQGGYLAYQIKAGSGDGSGKQIEEIGLTLDQTVFNLTVTPSTDIKSGNPGASVPYTLQITNTGNTTDTFDVEVSGNAWLTVTDPTTAGPLAAGESAGVVVTVNIPTSAAGGDSDTVTVMITSRGDPTKSVSSTLTTEALPAGWDIYLPLILRNAQ